jgi:lipid-binding SYLF domain-containing protein
MTRPISRRGFAAAAAAAAATATLSDPARADGRADALDSLAASKATLDKVIGDPAMTGFANALGGARGIVIMPKLLTVGFLVGYSTGTGLLLARHGAQWSDGVFLHVHRPSAGFQAGVQQAQILMLLMANRGPALLLDGSLRAGGSGGFALGNMGLGGGAGGGATSGLDLLTVNYASGIFAGSSFEGTQMSIDRDRNAGLHGAGFDVHKIAGAPGGNPEMAALRAALAAATAKAQAG